MTQPAQEQSQTDDGVQHDHQDGKHGIAPERRSGFAAKRHRGDQHDFDDHD